jgi:hypothetical protein
VPGFAFIELRTAKASPSQSVPIHSHGIAFGIDGGGTGCTILRRQSADAINRASLASAASHLARDGEQRKRQG